MRDFAAKQGVSEQEALEKEMEVKSVEFVRQGAEVYHKALLLNHHALSLIVHRASQPERART